MVGAVVADNRQGRTQHTHIPSQPSPLHSQTPLRMRATVVVVSRRPLHRTQNLTTSRTQSQCALSSQRYFIRTGHRWKKYLRKELKISLPKRWKFVRILWWETAQNIKRSFTKQYCQFEAAFYRWTFTAPTVAVCSSVLHSRSHNNYYVPSEKVPLNKLQWNEMAIMRFINISFNCKNRYWVFDLDPRHSLPLSVRL